MEPPHECLASVNYSNQLLSTRRHKKQEQYLKALQLSPWLRSEFMILTLMVSRPHLTTAVNDFQDAKANVE